MGYQSFASRRPNRICCVSPGSRISTRVGASGNGDGASKVAINCASSALAGSHTYPRPRRRCASSGSSQTVAPGRNVLEITPVRRVGSSSCGLPVPGTFARTERPRATTHSTSPSARSVVSSISAMLLSFEVTWSGPQFVEAQLRAQGGGFSLGKIRVVRVEPCRAEALMTLEVALVVLRGQRRIAQQAEVPAHSQRPDAAQRGANVCAALYHRNGLARQFLPDRR